MARADKSHTGSIGEEMAYCPACDLKHVRQPDWLCPQCGMPVETEAWRSAVRKRGADEPEPELGFPLGSFVAGVVMALTGVVLGVGFARHPVSDHRWPLVVAMVVLGVLALELLLKVSWSRWLVIALVGIVMLAAADDLLRAWRPALTTDPLPPPVRAALHGVIGALGLVKLLSVASLLVGALLLVVGRPGRARIAAGIVVAAPLALAELVRWFLV